MFNNLLESFDEKEENDDDEDNYDENNDDNDSTITKKPLKGRKGVNDLYPGFEI